MEGILKNRVILILFILNIIFLLIAVNSCGDALRQKKLKEKEIYNRLSSEEKIEDWKKQNSILEEKFKKIKEELRIEKAASEITKKALVQEQLVNQSLKEELEKVNKLKQALEEDLKEALFVTKSAKAEKPKK